MKYGTTSSHEPMPAPMKWIPANSNVETTAQSQTLNLRESLPISRWRNRYSSTNGPNRAVTTSITGSGTVPAMDSNAAWFSLVTAWPVSPAMVAFTAMVSIQPPGSINHLATG